MGGFSRQRRDRFLCLADFFRLKASGELDVVAFHLVTMGPKVAEATGEIPGFAVLVRVPGMS
jgi:5-methyltetrahydrofolate--homocysteine methyltransferase